MVKKSKSESEVVGFLKVLVVSLIDLILGFLGFLAESKSKRVTLSKKYKVMRKVKEHRRKKAKKLGLHRKPKFVKDPGIPNDWPFKEQELKALEERRARAVLELEQKKGPGRVIGCL